MCLKLSQEDKLTLQFSTELSPCLLRAKQNEIKGLKETSK